MGTPADKVLSGPSKHSRQNRISPDGSSSSVETALPSESKVIPTALCYIHCGGLCLNVLHWQLSLEYSSRNKREIHVIFCGCSACTGHGIAPKLPSSTSVDRNSQLKSLTKPIICCWSNSSNSSNSCVYEAFCQRIWCMSVSLVGRQTRVLP